jgi:hypothetical protein
MKRFWIGTSIALFGTIAIFILAFIPILNPVFPFLASPLFVLVGLSLFLIAIPALIDGAYPNIKNDKQDKTKCH